MMEEIFVPIVGYEGLYEVSNRGRVKSLSKIIGRRRKPETILKSKINIHGYLFVGLCKDSKYEYPTVHKLVGIYFVPNPLGYKQLNHIDGNPLNPSCENLEWCDQSRNMNHAYYELNKKHHINKPVKQVDLSGNVVNIFKSKGEAKSFLGLSSSTGIYRALNSNSHLAYGYKWEYV